MSGTAEAELGFEQHCRSSVDRLCAALIELYADVGADPSSPQDVARRLGLNKNLTWKISKIINADDLIGATPHVPGSGGMQILLKGFASAGAGNSAVDRVRSAAESFEQMVEIQVGDRATLELVLDGLAPGATDRLEMSRKLAFRGNSGVWGVQAKTRLAAHFMIPNADDPSKLDMATVRGYVGFRRLRPKVRWPLFRIREWADANEPMLAAPRWEPIENGSERGACLMHSFSTARLPDIEAVQTPEGLDYMLTPGPIGNFGVLDCIQGEMMRAAVSLHATDDDPIASLGSVVTVPAEHLVIDLIAHESMPFVLDAEAVVHGREFPPGLTPGQDEDEALLPISETPSRLSGTPPVVATPLVPRYAELFGVVCDRLGCDPRELRGVRLQMRYPPMGATAMLRFRLPEA